MTRGVQNPIKLKRDVRIIDYVDDIQRAIGFIQIGCRPSIVIHELPKLSRDTVIKLYYELTGKFPPKGMLPSSEVWFMHCRRVIEATEFVLIRSKSKNLVDAYVKYILKYPKPMMDATRAWTLMRMFDCGLLKMQVCTICAESSLQIEGTINYVCKKCNPPYRNRNAKRGAREPHGKAA